MSDIYLLYLTSDDQPSEFRLVDDNQEYPDLGKLVEELSTESDRGAVIISVAVLEGLLGDILATYLQNGDEIEDTLGSFGPLGSLSTRADICFGLGLLSKKERTAIRKIQKIRNRFAHILSVSFANQDISDRCSAISFAEFGPDSAPISSRDVFLANVLNLLLELADRPEFIQVSDRPTIEIRRTLKHFGGPKSI